MRYPILFACIAAMPGLWSQTRVYISAPQVQLISGNTLQLSAVARDSSGNLISNAAFQWSTSDKTVAPIDSNGVFTASALGLADITATYAGAAGVVRIQVLPQRIDVTPSNISIPFGSQQLFTAVAYDANNRPMPNVNFTWHFGVYSGGDSTTVPINNGLVTATTLGHFMVRAAVVYPYTPEQFQLEFDGQTPATIVPPNLYSLSRLASNNYSKPQFALRGRRTTMTAGEDGTLYFSGILDGMANGLMQLSNGAISPVQMAGGPSFLPGVQVWDFDDPSIDSSGNVIARMANWGSGNMIVEQTTDGNFFPLVMDGVTDGDGLTVNSIYSNHYSLSDMGDVVFRGSAYGANPAVNPQGMFRFSNGFVQEEVSITDTLPGFNGSVTSFDGQFGIDAKGSIYFIARGSTAAVYAKQAGGDPVRLIGFGDMAGGYPINAIYQSAISRNGTVFVYGSTAGGPNYLAVYPNGQAPGKIFSFTWYINVIQDANATGTIVFNGDAGLGYGIYTWNPLKDASPQPLIRRGQPLPTGEPFYEVYSATLNLSGQVYAAVRGVDSPWILLSLRPTMATLAVSGDPFPAPANLNLYPALVLGDKTGPVHMLAGGNQSSLFVVDKQNITPFEVVNDKLPGGGLYSGTNPIRKSASGALYISTDQALYRSDSSGITQVLAIPFINGAVTNYGPYNMAVNDQKQAVIIGGTSANYQTLTLVDSAGYTNVIAYFNSGGPNFTSIPGGGVFSGLNDVAINESGVVMVNVTASGAQGGLFVYDGSSWQTVCQLQKCVLNGRTVTSISQLKSSANQFCAFFNNSANAPSVSCWENGNWTSPINWGDQTSDGTQVSGIGSFDINRHGDVAAAVWTNGFGGPSIFLVSGGNYTTVNATLFPTADGITFRSVNSIDLRDDGRIFFTGFDFYDRVFLYEADLHQ